MSKKEEIINGEQMVEDAFNELINDYVNSKHRRKVELITKAFNVANEAHKGVKRKSGEPYILHPIAVAKIVCNDIGLGSTSISAALLHDVVEDTDYTVEDLKMLFGEKIANIVDGLTKISSGMFGENVSAQAENFRKLLLTMSEDIRVILIKIADRLHNMRTLGAMSPAKQYKIAGETIYIYAPLAHRLGLFAIKTELEDLSFKYENPEAYNNIVRKLEETKKKRSDEFLHFAEPINERLKTLGIRFEIKSREKSVYSIWNKMQKKSVSFEEIYDIFAVRIIFDTMPGEDERKRCWDIYTVITEIYRLKPDRIRDWVSRPKANGYQALHLTVMGPDGEWMEVQIRSRRMDDIAEKGFAAHWKYKEGKIEEDNEFDKWIKTVQEVLTDPNPNAIDFLDTIKLNLFSQEIFVFTPKGQLRTLAQGATALDFAYDLHSDIGNRCIGAKINHNLVPLSQKLNSGDQVEILTSKTQQPQPEWVNIVTTAKARTKVEQALRKIRKEVVKLGEERFRFLLKEANVEVSQPVIDRVLDYYKLNKKEDLFYAIGSKNLELPNKLNKLVSDSRGNRNFLIKYVKQAMNVVKKSDDKSNIVAEITNAPIDKKATYVLEENGFKKNFKVLDCCNPIPGDKVFGFVNEKNEVEVHAINCPVGIKLKASQGDKIVNVTWSESSQFSFLATIIVRGIDRIGMINDITKSIISDSFNIKIFNIESNDGIFEGRIKLYVHNVKSLQKLCTQIHKIKGVESVNRLT
ncbi:guanosine-3',5'-bis(diphosphate) 3'-pyrophosphohydrolase [Dysgonomonas sp. PH5-45]|uniref:RelA/SpoT family protein n=1 Tax=unclassified Dysgonomonas TaxID=2630389 RepID=UPI0024752B00|nr:MULTISPECIES: RelA/SpoT family protein [unclassified Dysgonomonas]MDH6355377.1 guanosine-3',5'-bis(diphosphate) 3'-pyrophosphohydrolase [Dysgonomonas sp. PH5-45]MDH6388275.1 guanosine-3',5'-bis(diphosphate) 3'-pyrophosphohydrolase [Dysgonomonas sp. PH5-37]